MPETIKLELSSRTAIIKKPDSNETYYTYTFPHKIMLLGLLGAIIGLNGYNYYALKKQLNEQVEELPEFYTKLEKLKIGIVPKIKYTNFTKKIQVFNNSVGYASSEVGNNLIVKEQWLENPCWDIYILEDSSEEYAKLKEYLVHNKCEYIPYIGKNDHFASISKVEVKCANIANNVSEINSIFIQNIATEQNENFEDILAWDKEKDKEFYYKEVLPTKLSEKVGYYDFKPFIFTNKKLRLNDEVKVFKVNEEIIYYF